MDSHTQKQWTATLKNNGQPHSLACLILGNKMHLDHTDSKGMSYTSFQLSAPTARQLGAQRRETRSDGRMFLWVDKVLQFNSLWLTLINLEKPNTISNEIVGNYLPNPSTGRFIIILPPGKYTVQVESPGFQENKYLLDIFDKVSYQSEKNLTITLTK